MKEELITNNSEETKNLGQKMAEEFQDGGIVCLVGELGSGKTTFTQGLLEGLKIPGPYTSPTFVIMKKYEKQESVNSEQENKNIYHIDAYRVSSDDILNIGWDEIVADKNNVIIIEWADRIRNIIPENAVWIKFEWIDENKRKIKFEADI